MLWQVVHGKLFLRDAELLNGDESRREAELAAKVFLEVILIDLAGFEQEWRAGQLLVDDLG